MKLNRHFLLSCLFGGLTGLALAWAGLHANDFKFWAILVLVNVWVLYERIESEAKP